MQKLRENTNFLERKKCIQPSTTVHGAGKFSQDRFKKYKKKAYFFYIRSSSNNFDTLHTGRLFES
jgi:hypothetical protein